MKWLAASGHHYLCVLAYNDAVALLNGTNFVSAAGGTWGKSHAMQRDLAEDLKFTTQTNAEFQRFAALDGRVQFILKENPEKKIFHTVQVERNGFQLGDSSHGRELASSGGKAEARRARGNVWTACKFGT